jgi:serine protease AprX
MGRRAQMWKLGAIVGTLTGFGIASLPLTAASASSNSLVIVTSIGSTSPLNAVVQAGGQILTQYTIINGVEASVPSTALASLASLPGLIVTPDVSVAVQSAPVSTGPHTPSDAFITQTGADQLAAAGDRGQGITVAVLDTGIDNLPDFQGRLIGGTDLTKTNNPFDDDYGHGTFVAGLIAGNGASSNGQYSGEAPAANLVAIKVAGADGSTKLGTIIKGLDWADKNESKYNIRVLNMSLGYQPTQSTENNPLDQAVERLWNDGVAVVTSAGNAGPDNGTILSPGDDPLAITVGALDDMAQANVANDEMNDFSSAGPTYYDGWAKPDLVASGRSVVSLAAPGSTIYNNNPSARIGSGNFVGSGTSFSSAITSGAAALVLADNPSLTPNQLKGRLLAETNPGPVSNPYVDGHGALNAYAAATTTANINYNQSTAGVAATPNNATVSLSPTGPCNTWNPALWTGTEWNGTEWNGTEWNGTEWNGTEWNGFAFAGAAWNGAAWNGTEWNGAAWNGTEWNGAAWNGTEWNGAAWNGAAWNGTEWNGAAWNGTEWNGTEWN